MSTSTPIQASGNNLRNILALVRRAKGWKLLESRIELISGGEDSLYRVHLSNGSIVEATVIQHARCAIHVAPI